MNPVRRSSRPLIQSDLGLDDQVIERIKGQILVSDRTMTARIEILRVVDEMIGRQSIRRRRECSPHGTPGWDRPSHYRRGQCWESENGPRPRSTVRGCFQSTAHQCYHHPTRLGLSHGKHPIHACVPHNQMDNVDLDVGERGEKKSTVEVITVRLRSGATVLVPVYGRDEEFGTSDIFYCTCS